MSTRSATIISEERQKWSRNDEGIYETDGTELKEIARFYRHHDGYPSGHGWQMALSFANTKDDRGRTHWFQNYFTPLMSGEGLKGTEFEDWGAPRLEFEPKSVHHSDLEFIYAVTRYIGGDIYITVWAIDWDEPYEEAMKDLPLFSGTPQEYIDWARKTF